MSDRIAVLVTKARELRFQLKETVSAIVREIMVEPEVIPEPEVLPRKLDGRVKQGWQRKRRMTKAQRLAVSKRMTVYWAEQRRAKKAKK